VWPTRWSTSGSGAGEQGGRIVFSGPSRACSKEPRSLTGKYLRGELAIPVPDKRRRGRRSACGSSESQRAQPQRDRRRDPARRVLTCVTGVSGSGKSTLVHDVIYAAIKRAKGDWEGKVGAHRGIEGALT
jgi:excinuclease ABC subunit A